MKIHPDGTLEQAISNANGELYVYAGTDKVKVDMDNFSAKALLEARHTLRKNNASPVKLDGDTIGAYIFAAPSRVMASLFQEIDPRLGYPDFSKPKNVDGATIHGKLFGIWVVETFKH